MEIVFRCNRCETINEIPSEYLFRFCKSCGKIIRYSSGEAIICEANGSKCIKFLNVQKLPNALAELFFSLAEEDEFRISNIIRIHEDKEIEMLDLPAASVSDTVLLILKECNSEVLDDIIRNCLFFNISESQLEKILFQLKKEGVIYQPKSWLVKLA
jgi:hypothetical protein